MRTLLAAVREPRFRVCLRLIYECGLRLNEGLHIQPKDIARADLRLHVRMGKGVKDRCVSLSPYIALRIGLLAWLGRDGSPEAARFPWLPFGGLFSHWPLNRMLLEQVWSVAIPSLVAVILVAVFTRRIGPSLLALIGNVAVLVVFLPTPSYDSIVASSRIALGVTCAFMACLPVIPEAQ